jgi:hypothetical protein
VSVRNDGIDINVGRVIGVGSLYTKRKNGKDYSGKAS